MSSLPTYDLYSDTFRANAYQVYAAMRATSPVVHATGLDATFPIWFVTGAAEVEQVLTDSRRFARDPARVSPQLAADFQTPDPRIRAITDNHMLNYDGDNHRRLRTLVSKAFTPRVIETMRPRVVAIAESLIDAVAGQGRMELIDEYAFPLPITVIAELLGVPTNKQQEFREWSDAFVRPAMTLEEQQQAEGQLRAFAMYMQELVAERRQSPRDDLISRLILVEEQGDKLNESELFSMIALLIVAGHETTVSLIGNAAMVLLQHPDTMAELRANPALIPGAVEELLRYQSPVDRALIRFVVEDTTLGDQQLRHGDFVIAVLGSANRDSARFGNADELDIHRAPNQHLAFGKGMHYCLGAPLARLEAAVAIEVLLRRCPDLHMDIEQNELRWRPVPLFRSLTRLPVSWRV